MALSTNSRENLGTAGFSAVGRNLSPNVLEGLLGSMHHCSYVCVDMLTTKLLSLPPCIDDRQQPDKLYIERERQRENERQRGREREREKERERERQRDKAREREMQTCTHIYATGGLRAAPAQQRTMT